MKSVSGIGDTAYFRPRARVLHLRQREVAGRHVGLFRRRSSPKRPPGTPAPDYEPAIRPPSRSRAATSPVPPVDSFQDMRSEMCLMLESLGIPVEVHHHEVANAGQMESAPVQHAGAARRLAAELQNTSSTTWPTQYGKTATFMPKPIVGDNGSGMHVHQSVWKDGKNLFAGDGYAGLSEFALYYIGGIIKHARAQRHHQPRHQQLQAPGARLRAPVMLAYSAKNRSASIRIPWANPKGRRIEARFPDPTGQPVPGLSRAADGRPGRHGEQDPPGRGGRQGPVPPAAGRRREDPDRLPQPGPGAGHLDKDRGFLTKGGVFTDDIDAYIELKMQEVQRFRMTTHPVEFDMYYSLLGLGAQGTAAAGRPCRRRGPDAPRARNGLDLGSARCAMRKPFPHAPGRRRWLLVQAAAGAAGRTIVYRCPGNVFTDRSASKRQTGERTGLSTSSTESNADHAKVIRPAGRRNPAGGDAQAAPSPRAGPQVDLARSACATPTAAHPGVRTGREEGRQLADLQTEYNNGEPERRGDERNYQKYLDRVADEGGIARRPTSRRSSANAKLPPS